eukprot:2694325-Amphidinium_carterae.1
MGSYLQTVLSVTTAIVLGFKVYCKLSARAHETINTTTQDLTGDDNCKSNYDDLWQECALARRLFS